MFRYVGKIILYVILWLLLIITVIGIIAFICEEVNLKKISKKCSKLMYESDILGAEGKSLIAGGDKKNGEIKIKESKDKKIAYEKIINEIVERENNRSPLWKIGFLGIVLLVICLFIGLVVILPLCVFGIISIL